MLGFGRKRYYNITHLFLWPGSLDSNVIAEHHLQERFEVHGKIDNIALHIPEKQGEL